MKQFKLSSRAVSFLLLIAVILTFGIYGPAYDARAFIYGRY